MTIDFGTPAPATGPFRTRAESRRLGTLEWINWLTRSNLVWESQITGPLTADVVRQSLDHLQRRHPLLRAQIVPGPGSYLVFRTCDSPSIPLRHLRVPRTSWLAEAEREFREPFSLRQVPLARCALLQHEASEWTVLFTLSHALSDARSAVYLLRDLLQAAEAVVQGQALAWQPLNLQPPAEDFVARALPARHRWSHFVRETFGSSGSGMSLRRARWLPPEPGLETEPRSCILPRSLSPDLVTGLVERCRRERTTVHGALCAAQLRALAEEHVSEDGVDLYLASPVSLQGRIPSTITDDLLLFASGVEAFRRVSLREPFWQLARSIRERLLGGSAPLQRLAGSIMSIQALSHLRRWLPGDETGFRRLRRLSRWLAPPMNIVTNIGTLSIASQYGPFQAHSFGFVVNNGLIPLLSTAATLNQTLSWHFVWNSSFLSQVRAERLANRAVSLVQESTAGR